MSVVESSTKKKRSTRKRRKRKAMRVMRIDSSIFAGLCEGCSGLGAVWGQFGVWWGCSDLVAGGLVVGSVWFWVWLQLGWCGLIGGCEVVSAVVNYTPSSKWSWRCEYESG